MDFQSLFSLYAGASFDRQLALAELIGERGWGMNLNEGVIRFGEDLAFGVQLLGSENDAGNWLWAWANTQSDLPPELLQAVAELRQLGREESVDELTTAQFDLPEGRDGHHLAMVAGGILGCSPYYRAPYSGGALYFLVEVNPCDLEAARPLVTIPSTISQVISSFDLDHRAMVRGLLESRGFEVADSETGVRAQHGEGHEVTVDFDSEGRVSQIGGTFEP